MLSKSEKRQQTCVLSQGGLEKLTTDTLKNHSKMNNDKIFCDYVLVIMKASGLFVRRYFPTYEQMEDYSIYLQFSPNVEKAWGIHRKNRKLVRCFTLG
jgi:hypothetical protein